MVVEDDQLKVEPLGRAFVLDDAEHTTLLWTRRTTLRPSSAGKAKRSPVSKRSLMAQLDRRPSIDVLSRTVDELRLRQLSDETGRTVKSRQMKIHPTGLPEILLIEPQVFTDPSGEFLKPGSTRHILQNLSIAAGLRPR